MEKWAVFYKIPAETQDDGREKMRVVAVFEWLISAEEYIEKVLPNKERFFIAPVVMTWPTLLGKTIYRNAEREG